MRITILSEVDYAGSGHKLWQALSRHTSHNVEIFSGKYDNKLKLPQHPIRNQRQAQRIVDASDIIHLKGDFPPREGYLGLKILHKPIIITVSGSHFRKKEHGGYGKYNVLQYKHTVKRTSFEPDLCYPEFMAEWVPHPIDSTDKPRLWKRNQPPVLMHMATNQTNKDTPFIREVFKQLEKRNNIITTIPKIMTFSQAVELRKASTIYFDQFKVGFYGNSALEAMQFGIPVGCYISQLSLFQGLAEKGKHPVITAPKIVKLWVEKIECLLGADLDKLSQETKQWCDEVHSYESVAKRWNEIYGSL